MRHGLIGLMLVVGTAAGQAQEITAYRLRILGPAPSTAVAWEGNLPMNRITCGLPVGSASVEPQVANPTALRWVDPSNPVRECEYRDAGMVGPMQGLPLNAANVYAVEIAARTVAGWGPIASAANTFTREGQAPSTPLANVRLVK